MGGTFGAILITLIYTLAINKIVGMQISYIYIALVGFVLSILSQIGDLSASSIKRTMGIKDFGNLIPGHGGMLDRIDSIIFIAPFAYYLLTLIYKFWKMFIYMITNNEPCFIVPTCRYIPLLWS